MTIITPLLLLYDSELNIKYSCFSINGIFLLHLLLMLLFLGYVKHGFGEQIIASIGRH